MARQRPLRNAPITEALIQFQFAPQNPDEFLAKNERFAAALAPHFYPKGQIQQGTLQVAMTPHQDVPLMVQTDSQATGIRLHSQDEKYVIQATNRAFTLSRLEPYETWEALREKLRQLWALFQETYSPGPITLVAIRYINTIFITVGPEARLERIFTRPPTEPEGMPEIISSFLTRCVIEDPPSQASVIVTLASQSPQPPNTYPVILDIEAVRQAEFPSDTEAVWAYLEKLRNLKNAAFFGSLTENQVKQYE